MSRWVKHAKHRNVDWILEADDGAITEQAIQAAVLMDIRAELRRLNELLHCSNFTGIPQTLKSIRRRMGPAKPKRKAKR